jgi:methyl-accepting chemotaxis protein
MKLAQSIRLGAWFLIALNIVMAFGSIWIFMRMAPAIEIIIEQNEKSLHACEEMLSTLVLVNQKGNNDEHFIEIFSKALDRAKSNITEKEEPIAIEAIRVNYVQAFEGKSEGVKKTVAAILDLAKINRDAMVKADWKARQFGNAGAWGIVFMASAVFTIGMLFIRGLKKSLVKPLEEIYSVIQAVKAGDSMRRCTGADAPHDIKAIYYGVNELLDNDTSDILNNKKWAE